MMVETISKAKITGAVAKAQASGKTETRHVETPRGNRTALHHPLVTRMPEEPEEGDPLVDPRLPTVIVADMEVEAIDLRTVPPLRQATVEEAKAESKDHAATACHLPSKTTICNGIIDVSILVG
jgi:hypothetical protein